MYSYGIRVHVRVCMYIYLSKRMCSRTVHVLVYANSRRLHSTDCERLVDAGAPDWVYAPSEFPPEGTGPRGTSPQDPEVPSTRRPRVVTLTVRCTSPTAFVSLRGPRYFQSPRHHVPPRWGFGTTLQMKKTRGSSRVDIGSEPPESSPCTFFGTRNHGVSSQAKETVFLTMLQSLEYFRW